MSSGRELLRRARARPDGGVQVQVSIVRDLEQAAELVDVLGARLLAGETVVALWMRSTLIW